PLAYLYLSSNVEQHVQSQLLSSKEYLASLEKQEVGIGATANSQNDFLTIEYYDGIIYFIILNKERLVNITIIRVFANQTEINDYLNVSLPFTISLKEVTTYDAPFYFGYPAIAIKVTNSEFYNSELVIQTSLGNVFVVQPISSTLLNSARLANVLTSYSTEKQANIQIGNLSASQVFNNLLASINYISPFNFNLLPGGLQKVNIGPNQEYPQYTTISYFPTSGYLGTLVSAFYKDQGIYNGTFSGEIYGNFYLSAYPSSSFQPRLVSNLSLYGFNGNISFPIVFYSGSGVLVNYQLFTINVIFNGNLYNGTILGSVYLNNKPSLAVISLSEGFPPYMNGTLKFINGPYAGKEWKIAVNMDRLSLLYNISNIISIRNLTDNKWIKVPVNITPLYLQGYVTTNSYNNLNFTINETIMPGYNFKEYSNYTIISFKPRVNSEVYLTIGNDMVSIVTGNGPQNIMLYGAYYSPFVYPKYNSFFPADYQLFYISGTVDEGKINDGFPYYINSLITLRNLNYLPAIFFNDSSNYLIFYDASIYALGLIIPPFNVTATITISNGGSLPITFNYTLSTLVLYYQFYIQTFASTLPSTGSLITLTVNNPLNPSITIQPNSYQNITLNLLIPATNVVSLLYYYSSYYKITPSIAGQLIVQFHIEGTNEYYTVTLNTLLNQQVINE
ncbi:hypothetical protein DJ529_11430, partial [Sulfolobus sp. C3]